MLSTRVDDDIKRAEELVMDWAPIVTALQWYQERRVKFINHSSEKEKKIMVKDIQQEGVLMAYRTATS